MANTRVNIITSLVTLDRNLFSIHCRLSISGIINLLDIKMMDIYRNSFTETQWQHVLDEEKSININSYSGLNDKSNNILDRLLALRNTDKILEYIDEQKYVLFKSKQISQQLYIMLLIVEQMQVESGKVQYIVRNFARWS
ncbi:hypothetical protein BD770DRAFT_435251 [Pilaira anomala]|nr:hypothetical protein BD770DRAFT_435251 [Pilaira anomala]